MPIWIIATQWLSRSVLGLLVFLSVWSCSTMIRSFRLLKEAQGLPELFLNEFNQISGWIEEKKWGQLKEWASKARTLHGGTTRVILSSFSLGSSQIDRAVRSHLTLERTRLESGLTVLATLGSNAPFIGLFGTVLGIIQAFGALGVHQNNTSEIMVGISEALVATAVGLFVAIPAVVAFNVLSRKLKILLVRSEALKDLCLSRFEARFEARFDAKFEPEAERG